MLFVSSCILLTLQKLTLSDTKLNRFMLWKAFDKITNIYINENALKSHGNILKDVCL